MTRATHSDNPDSFKDTAFSASCIERQNFFVWHSSDEKSEKSFRKRMPFDTRFCDGYLTIKPRKSQKSKATTPRSSLNNVHHVQNIFHKAVEEGDMTQVKVLLRYAQNNIHLGEPNKHGRTAMQECCLKDNLEMIRLLLDHGALLESTDVYGWTALHYAAFFGSLNIVRFLVLNCADLMSTNNNGETAYELAQNQDVKYYLHGMMMLRDDDGAHTDDDNATDNDVDEYDNEDIYEYYDDKISWKHESDNDSLGNSINCKTFDEIGQCDSRETVDTGYYGDSQPSSPSCEGDKMYSPNQNTLSWLGKNKCSSSLKASSDDEIFRTEMQQSLKMIEDSCCDEIDDDDDDDDEDDEKRNSVICMKDILEKGCENSSSERHSKMEEDAQQKDLKIGGEKFGKEKIKEANEDLVILSSGNNGQHELVRVEDVRSEANENENKNEEKKVVSDNQTEIRMDKRNRKVESSADFKKFEETVKKLVPEKIHKPENEKKEIKEKIYHDVSGVRSQKGTKSPQKVDKNEIKGKKKIIEGGKDRKTKSKEKSRSKIPSAIPRFKRKTENEKEEEKKKVQPGKGNLINFSANETMAGSKNYGKLHDIENKNKKGLEGLWERFRLLAARRNSNGRNEKT